VAEDINIVMRISTVTCKIILR